MRVPQWLGLVIICNFVKMNEPQYTETGNLIISFHTEKEKEKDGFLPNTILTFQLSGNLSLETSTEKISTKSGDILLVRKNQLVKVSKLPFEGDAFRTITILFEEEALRNYALKNDIKIQQKYKGKLNIFVPETPYLKGFVSSLLAYGENPNAHITARLGELKIEEAIELLLQIKPELKEFLFDFSELYKIDLEKFMSLNYQFNVPIEKFAQLTGRSVASFKRDFQKTFNTSPRKWLQNQRLTEAFYLIDKKKKKPSEIYLELGFESISHFSNAFKEKYGLRPTQLKT